MGVICLFPEGSDFEVRRSKPTRSKLILHEPPDTHRASSLSQWEPCLLQPHPLHSGASLLTYLPVPDIGV